jgi:hypothetical protein
MIPPDAKSLLNFVRRAGLTIVGRSQMLRSRSNLHFVILADETSDRSRAEILKDFAPYPIVGGITEAEIQEAFGLNGTRVLGIAKSDLAKSLYQHLKSQRINKPD